MPDFQDSINKILSNPEALKQIQSLSAQLGLSNKMPELQNNKSQRENRKSINTSNNNQSIYPSNENNQPKNFGSLSNIANSFSPEMLSMVTKFAPLLQNVGKEDDTTKLLNSLRPFLGIEKQEKIDKAEKMLKLLKLLPLIKDNGLFSGLI